MFKPFWKYHFSCIMHCFCFIFFIFIFLDFQCESLKMEPVTAKNQDIIDILNQNYHVSTP